MRILAATLALIFAAPAAAVSFSNPTPIVIADISDTSSVIGVSGVAGAITGMTLTVAGLGHTYPDDLVMGVYNESQGLAFVFLSYVGDSSDIDGVTLTFSDAATGYLPESFIDGLAITSGTYLPSNFGGFTFDNFTNVASFAGFNGNSVNGNWTLLIADIFAEDSGIVAGGWSLDFTTAAVPEPASWALMIGGFAMTGVALRRRKAPLAT